METPRNSYPFEREGCVRLSDELVIRVRVLRPFEELPIRELFEGLRLNKRSLRFLSPLRVMPESLLRRLVSVDDHRQVAFVAEYDGGAGVETIALGSFAAVDDEAVEVGLVVRDDWQGRRLGSALAARILDAAEACGFHQFIAHVTAGNAAIRRIIRNLGRIVAAGKTGVYVWEGPTPTGDPEVAELFSQGGSPSTEDEVRGRALDALAEEIRLMLDERVVEDVRDIDLAMLLGAGWPFHLGGITPYLDRQGVSERVTGQRFLPPGVASLPARP